MTYTTSGDDLDCRSRVELIGLVQQLREQLAAAETSKSQLQAALAPGEPYPEDEQRVVRQALQHLHDPVWLTRSRLAALVAQRIGRSVRGEELQEMLGQALQYASSMHEPRLGRLLQLTYVAQRPRSEVVCLVALSVSQYSRLLRQAVRAVAYHLSRTTENMTQI